MISPRQISLFTEEELTSSPVDSLANPIQWQEKEKEKRILDTSGQRCSEQFEKFSQNGSWAKMFSDLLIGMEGWYSTRCKLTWKLKGTKYNRMYFQLQVSTLPTEGTEYGLLLTPNLVQIAETPEKYQERQKKRTEDGLNQAPHPNNKYNCLLSQVLYSGLLKTPTKMDGEVTSGKKNPISGNSGTLAQEIMSEYPPTMKKLGLIPTPQASDFVSTVRDNDYSLRHLEHQSGWVKKMLPTPVVSDKNAGRRGNAPRAGHNPMTNSLKDAMNYQEQTSKCSHLSPQFVLEMMGFPTDWTLLPFLNGETNQSKQEETQSSLK